MNILLVHQSSDLYGSDKVFLDTIKVLSGRQHKLIVALPTRGPLSGVLERYDVHVYFADVVKVDRSTATILGMIRFLRSASRSYLYFRRLIEKEDIDIIYSNTIATFSGAIQKALHPRLRHIWHVHEIISNSRLLSFLFRKAINQLSDLIICNSEATARWISDADGKKNRVIYNPVSLGETNTECTASGLGIRGEYEIPSQAVVVGLVGRINAWKGHFLLLEALNYIEKRDDVYFFFVGDGVPGRADIVGALEAEVRKHSWSERIHLTGFRRDMEKIWSEINIALVPSIEPEPFGLVAIEAGAHAIPVIAAAHGGLSEIVIDEVTGLLFCPGDARELSDKLNKLLDQHDGDVLRSELGRAAVARVSSIFTFDAYEEKLLTVFSEVINTDGVA